MGNTQFFMGRIDLHPQFVELDSFSLYWVSSKATEVDSLGTVLLDTCHGNGDCR